MMVELFDAVASWHSLLLAVGAFGFAPGFILRVAVKIYPRHDPRRKEIIADLYVMRRIERPFYVAEQLETVLLEGLPQRFARLLYRILRPIRMRRSIERAGKLGELMELVRQDKPLDQLSNEDQAVIRLLRTQAREEVDLYLKLHRS